MRIKEYLTVILIGIFIFSCSSSDSPETENVVAETESKVVPVKLIEVTPEKVEWGMDVVGIILPDKGVKISAEVGGQVKEVGFNIGDYVRENDVLVKLDDEYKRYALTRAESQKMIAKADYEKSELDYQRYKTLFETKDVSEFDLENMRLKRDVSKANLMAAEAGYKSAQKQLDDTEIKAPYDGFVSRKMVETGDIAGIGIPVAKIIDIRFVKINVEVSEMDIPKIKVGAQVKINMDAYPGEIFIGSVATVSPEADDITKTFPVEIKLRNTSDYKIKPGMIAKGKIITDVSENTFLLPQDVVFDKEGKKYIFISDGDIARMNDVKVGRSYQNLIEVIDGVTGNEEIIASGSIFIKDGSKITVQK